MKQKKIPLKKLAIFLFIFLLFGVLYYQFVWKTTRQTLEIYSEESLEDEWMLMQAKAKKIKQMKQSMEKQKKENQGIIADYNNLQNEMLELNSILNQTTAYQMDFEDPTIDDSIIRRNIHISFQTKTYDTAKEVLQSLQDSTYRCLLKNIMISSDSSDLFQTKEVRVELEITFFEGINDTARAAGLNKYVDDSATNGG